MFRKIQTSLLQKTKKYYFSKNLYQSAENVKEKATKQYPRRIFSGIQPTGSIHLGNYLGAVAQWVKLQETEEDVILSIVDLHSMTLPHNPKELSRNILEMTATLLGCGINPKKVILFQQSAVPAHTSLFWDLACVATMARVAHIPTFKEKSENLKDVPVGLFIYPILQAADILAYKATHVPVGEDQRNNIQLSQDLARMFNNRFGETFPIPHTLITGEQYSRIKSLRDPLKKMSKSDSDPKSRICLTDRPEDITRNIKKAVTDFTSEVYYDQEKRPGVSNLLSIHSFVTNKNIQQICEEVKHLNTGEYKAIVSEAVIEYLKPIRKKIIEYLDDPQYLLDTLKAGGEKATEISEKNIAEVKFKLGLNVKIKQKTQKLRAS